jgi:O-antigen ligase
VSSLVSNHSQTALLKSSSLFLLFLYASCGLRVTLTDREERFFRGLLIGCESIAYLSGFAYLALRYEIFGNPNSLGAVMGIVVIPVLLWGTLIADQPNVRQRRTIALCLAVYLLISSLSRAALLGCAITVGVMCIALHRQRILINAAFLLITLTTVVAVAQPARFDAMISSLWEDVIYKGKPEEGLLSSRKSPWQETMDVIKESPWFGSGFGTDVMSVPRDARSIFRTPGGTAKEHGSSYLALLQYVGLLGIIPFAILLLLAVRITFRVFARAWRTADARDLALPLASVCLAGLIHAFLEDWLFAVGYYLTIFFWSSVFILSDLQPTARRPQFIFSRTWRRTPVPPSPISLPANR